MIPKGSKPIIAALALLVACAAAPPPAALADTGAAVSASGSPSWRSLGLGMERHPIYRRSPESGYHKPLTLMSIGGGVFDPWNQPGTDFYLNGTLEVEVAPQVDVGTLVAWYHRDAGSGSGGYTYTDPAGNVRYVGEDTNTDLIPWMATVRVRIPMGNLEPYVGGGLGYEWLTIDGSDPNGVLFHDDYGGFGMQGFGGMNLRVSRTAALYGEAVWNESTVSAEFLDPYGYLVHEELNFDGLAVHGGLRFRF